MENLLLEKDAIVTLYVNYIEGSSNRANRVKADGFRLTIGEFKRDGGANDRHEFM